MQGFINNQSLFKADPFLSFLKKGIQSIFLGDNGDRDKRMTPLFSVKLNRDVIRLSVYISYMKADSKKLLLMTF
jgi:hypothetical protein